MDKEQEKEISPNIKKLATSLSVIALLAGGLPATDYYLIPEKDVQGREIRAELTPYQFDSIRDSLKEKLDKEPQNISVNQSFAIQDIINYNCPNGFSVGEVKGSITIEQVKTLLDGNCGI